MSGSSTTYDDESGYDSFHSISPWTTPMSSQSPSNPHTALSRAGDGFNCLPSNACVGVPHDPQQLTAEYTGSVGTWMDGLHSSQQDFQVNMPCGFDSTSLGTPSFDQDFVLFDDCPQPARYSSRADAEASTLLRPTITLSPPPACPGTQPPSSRAADRHAISRTPSRRRASRPRISCNTSGCSKTFSRTSDLDRHIRNIHGQGNEYYECLSHRCLYRTRRKDKMQEHCQKVHAYARGQESFATIEDGDSSTPGSSVQDVR